MADISKLEEQANLLSRCMASCKDCVHYDVCYELTYHEPNGEIVGREVCNNFKDKTRFVELPCKVGDTIYKVWYLPCHNGETYPYGYSWSGCEDECDLKKTIFEFKVPSIQFIVNEFLGKDNIIYYLTREEAEKALKEREKK